MDPKRKYSPKTHKAEIMNDHAEIGETLPVPEEHRNIVDNTQESVRQLALEALNLEFFQRPKEKVKRHTSGAYID